MGQLVSSPYVNVSFLFFSILVFIKSTSSSSVYSCVYKLRSKHFRSKSLSYRVLCFYFLTSPEQSRTKFLGPRTFFTVAKAEMAVMDYSSTTPKTYRKTGEGKRRKPAPPPPFLGRPLINSPIAQLFAACLCLSAVYYPQPVEGYSRGAPESACYNLLPAVSPREPASTFLSLLLPCLLSLSLSLSTCCCTD